MYKRQFEDTVIRKSLETPVLVDFWATWCGPCKTLGPLLDKLAGDYNGAFVLAKVDVDQEQELAAAFQIRSVPTVMLVKDGQLVDGFPGVLPEGQLREFLKHHGIEPAALAEQAAAVETAPPLDPHAEVMRLRKAIEAEPDKSELALDLVVALLQTGAAGEAEHLLADLPGILVGTANGLQGMERAAAVVLHPLAGYRDPSAFGTDLGRACVMLSRHRCHLSVVTDTATPAVLAGDDPDPATVAHRRLLHDLTSTPLSVS